MVKKMAMGGYADGGMPMVMKDGVKVPAFAADGKGKMAKGGMPAALAKHAGKPASKAHAGLKAGGMTKMANGGSASKRADGVASKGKTKGTMVGMKSGGKTC
jgi:hypothetical protein